jgi:hypothetical protein
MSVYTRPPLTVSSNRLEEAGEKSIDGTTYNLWKSDEGLIDSGDPIQILVTANAGSSTTLLAGAGVAGLVLLLCVALGLRKRARARRPSSSRPAPVSRGDLLTRIAQLDLAYGSGELSKADWTRQRARLKNALAELEPDA